MMQEPNKEFERLTSTRGHTDYSRAAPLLCSRLARAMAITALFAFWGYWCTYLQLWGLFGVLHISFTFHIFAVFGAALGPASPTLQSLAPHPALGPFDSLL